MASMAGRMNRLFADTYRYRILAIETSAQRRQAERPQHHQRANPAGMDQAQVFDDQAATPGATER